MSSSRPESGFGVVLLQSTQAAIRAEKLLLAAGIAHKLIPVPRHLRSDCGFCLRFAWTDRDLVKDALSAASLGVEGFVPL